VEEYRREIDPAVASAHPVAYALPMSVVRLLWKGQQPGARDEMMRTVAGLHGKNLVAGLAAALQAATETKDWRLGGWLCFQLDRAIDRRFDPVGDGEAFTYEAGNMGQPAPPPHTPDSGLMALMDRVEKLLQIIVGEPYRKAWPDAVAGYLSTVPASFAPPPGVGGLLLQSRQAAPQASMPLLRVLIHVPAVWWLHHKPLRIELERAACPFVRDLVKRKVLEAEGQAIPVVAPWLAGGAEDSVQVKGDLFSGFLVPEDDPAQFEPPPPPPPPPQPAPQQSAAQPAAPRRKLLWIVVLLAAEAAAGGIAIALWSVRDVVLRLFH
jgi:hypothetical protein